MARADNQTKVTTTPTLRSVTRALRGKMMAKNRSPAMAIRVMTLATMAVTGQSETESV